MMWVAEAGVASRKAANEHHPQAGLRGMKKKFVMAVGGVGNLIFSFKY